MSLIGVSKKDVEEFAEDVDRELKNNERNINKVEHNLEDLEEEIQGLKELIAKIQENFKRNTDRIDNLEEEISSLNGDKRRLKEKVDTLEEDLEDKEAEINELKEGLQDRVTRPQMYKQIRKELRSVDRLELSEVVSLLHEIISIRNNEDRTIAKNQELLHKLYENGLNQGEIAELVGVSRQTINQNMQ